MPLKYFSQGYFKAKYFWRGLADVVVETLRRSLRTLVVTYQSMRSVFIRENETTLTGSVTSSSVSHEHADTSVLTETPATDYVRRPR